MEDRPKKIQATSNRQGQKRETLQQIIVRRKYIDNCKQKQRPNINENSSK